ncbi:uncharacterized protein B0I36DRAFT_406810 [Microdochium trichocladiopsis]|uniref:Heterokaryon incompatibility domain-containing protein n=1 Tax=Microdochium trichocladiopsis TaxID=1682393 RepID=A0A9P8YFH1_9PEZI|nr:uncharacterized protein B0I36DRAFT_406810 [Microdochium trichocladiopsis]KAH7035996.1 hypothetical protein B0I36DRAFT_406810 [Microdochium trichocladiopsis]
MVVEALWSCLKAIVIIVANLNLAWEIHRKVDLAKPFRVIWSCLTFGDAPWTVYPPLPYENLPTPSSIRLIRLQPLERGQSNSAEVWFDMRTFDLDDDPGDEEEKVAQINMMGRIYQSAKIVIVWLGTANIIESTGLQILHDMTTSAVPLAFNPVAALVTKQLTLYMERARKESRMAALRVQILPVIVLWLAARSWFSRVWVVQELAFARDVVYIYGKHEIHQDTMKTVCGWLVNHDSTTVGPDHSARKLWQEILWTFAPYMMNLPATLEARKDFAAGNMWSLTQWYLASSGRTATVGRDYVYGGLSLVKPELLTIDQGLVLDEMVSATGKDATHNQPEQLIVSHAQSLLPRGLWPVLEAKAMVLEAEVFVNAAACLLTHEGLGVLLRTAVHPGDRDRFRAEELDDADPSVYDTLPSWVPTSDSWTTNNWQIPSTTNIVPFGSPDPYAASGEPTSSDQAADSTAGNVSISPDGRHLSVSAAQIDHINSSPIVRGAIFSYNDSVMGLAQYLHAAWRGPQRCSSIPATTRTVGCQVDLDDPSQAAEGFIETPACLTVATPDFPLTAQSECPFEAVAAALIAGRIGAQPVSGAAAAAWLCESIVSHVRMISARTRHNIDEQLDRASRNLEELLVGQPEEVKVKSREMLPEKVRVSQRRQQEEADRAATTLASLRSKYTHLPWPRDKDISVWKEDLRLDGALARMEEATLLQEGAPGIGPLRRQYYHLWNHAFRPLRRARIKSEVDITFKRMVSEPCLAFEEQATKMLQRRSIFTTAAGRIVLGPDWLPPGATVMLLRGASTPFVLAREEDHLAARSKQLGERLKLDTACCKHHEKDSFAKLQRFSRLAGIEQRLQRMKDGTAPKDRWILVGDAYMSGAMRGELAAEASFEKVDIA